jgi:polysaccharide biosynthesis/export protein
MIAIKTYLSIRVAQIRSRCGNPRMFCAKDLYRIEQSLEVLMNVSRTAGYLLSGVLMVGLGNIGALRTQAQSSPTAAAALPESPAGKPKKANGKEAPATTAPVSESEESVYRIGVEDELQISVWREPDLSTTAAVVRPDGKITMPLLNDVTVIGLKPDELQELLAVKLKPFVNEPKVTVIARNIRSRRVYLFGQVSRQGAFPLNRNLTVLELIADAGGLNPFAKRGSIYVLRVVNGRKTQIPFNYRSALSGKGQNITLVPGDVVVVP